MWILAEDAVLSKGRSDCDSRQRESRLLSKFACVRQLGSGGILAAVAADHKLSQTATLARRQFGGSHLNAAIQRPRGRFIHAEGCNTSIPTRTLILRVRSAHPPSRRPAHTAAGGSGSGSGGGKSAHPPPKAAAAHRHSRRASPPAAAASDERAAAEWLPQRRYADASEQKAAAAARPAGASWLPFARGGVASTSAPASAAAEAAAAAERPWMPRRRYVRQQEQPAAGQGQPVRPGGGGASAAEATAPLKRPAADPTWLPKPRFTAPDASPSQTSPSSLLPPAAAAAAAVELSAPPPGAREALIRRPLSKDPWMLASRLHELDFGSQEMLLAVDTYLLKLDSRTLCGRVFDLFLSLLPLHSPLSSTALFCRIEAGKTPVIKGLSCANAHGRMCFVTQNPVAG